MDLVKDPHAAGSLTRSTTQELTRSTADTISENYPMETEDQYAMFLVPIFSPDDSSVVIGAMMIRSPVFLDELEELLAKTVLRESNSYLLDDRGAIATKARDLSSLLELPAFSSLKKVRGATIVEARDPGGNVLTGFTPTEHFSEWSWTKPGKIISQPRNGFDVNGYRDYRGREVVGAWNWIESLNRLLVLEVPKEEAFKSQVFIERAFRFLYGVPIVISLIIGALSLRRAFRGVELANKSLGSYILREKIGEGGLGQGGRLWTSKNHGRQCCQRCDCDACAHWNARVYRSGAIGDTMDRRSSRRYFCVWCSWRLPSHWKSSDLGSNARFLDPTFDFGTFFRPL